jgi:hypothetical protein
MCKTNVLAFMKATIRQSNSTFNGEKCVQKLDKTVSQTVLEAKQNDCIDNVENSFGKLK